MPSGRADRNLLFGIVALQTNFISRDAFDAAMREWVNNRERSLGEILSTRQILADTDQVLLDRIVERHLREHDSDVERSLEALLPDSAANLLREADCNVPIESDSLIGRRQPLATDRGAAAPAPRTAQERYEILWQHAKGGLGKIYVAEDTELHRRVALKEIRPTLAQNPRSRQRFLVEAEITGNLEHPGIVPVYGLGAYEDGRPFYAMRFIKGQELATAIHHFHQEGAVDFGGREFRWLLRRFIDVCNTIAYAHSRGVLHRDLKPANIMLGPFGETLVMDWGVAKPMSANGVETATDSSTELAAEVVLRPAAGASSITLEGQAVGTPAFMSPEQASGRQDSVGPGSDVYSLGATLYVLLTGERPFKGQPEEVLEQVRSGRFVAPRVKKPRVPRALDAVCRRAMALSADNRYRSALLLAEDIERWLADEPVLAWQAPWSDRARRWARRHQVLVAGWAAAVGVALLALSLAVPLLSMAWRNAALAHRKEEHQRFVALQKAAEAELERGRAVQSLKEANQERAAALAHEAIAHKQKDRAEKALAFLVEAFRKPDPLADGRALKVVDLLHQAVGDLDKSLVDQPLMQATLLCAIGRTYLGLGMPQDALLVLQRALELRRSELGGDQPETIEALHGVAQAFQDAGRLDKAIPILETTLVRRKSLLGDEHPDTVESMNDLAVAYWEDGQAAKAIPLYETTLSKKTREPGVDDSVQLTIMDNLAVAYGSVGRHKDAIDLHEKTLTRFRAKLGAEHVTTLISMNNLARAFEGGGRHEEAIRLYEATLPKLRAKLSDDHPTTLIAMHGLARAYLSAGAIAKAVPLFETTLAERSSKLGPYHPETLLSTFTLANAYCASKQPERGVPLARVFLLRIEELPYRLPESLRELIPRARQLVPDSIDQTARDDRSLQSGNDPKLRP
jgi:serine/threonine protein kinase